MNFFYSFLITLLMSSCTANDNGQPEEGTSVSEAPTAGKNGLWKGTFSNGMKGDSILFEVAGDSLRDLTFKGYWRCDRKLEQTLIGPSTAYRIIGDKVDGVIVEPENGAAPFYFEVHGTFYGNKASGTLKFDVVAAGCTTYKLEWTATKQ